MAIAAKRVGIALLTLLLVTSVTFVIIRSMPGDPIQQLANELTHNQAISYDEAYERVKSYYNYDPDLPMGQAFIEYLGSLLRGDLGKSMLYQVSVNEILAKALPWTLLILATSLLLSFGLGAFLGMVVAWRRRTALDPVMTFYAAFTGATPDYITALVLLIVFAINLGWFPVRGAYESGLVIGFNWPFVKSVLHHAMLPIIAFTFENTAAWTLSMKGSAVSVLGEDYIAAARARGLKEGRIMTRYLGRNAILPMVTGLAISLGSMLGGSTLIEYYFSYPGVGYFFSEAIRRRDFGMMQGLFLFQAAAVILANLVADLVYARLDPRIKMES